jgi:hypothetical protein
MYVHTSQQEDIKYWPPCNKETNIVSINVEKSFGLNYNCKSKITGRNGLTNFIKSAPAVFSVECGQTKMRFRSLLKKNEAKVH